MGFFKPDAGAHASAVTPSEAWTSYSDHLALSGQKLHPAIQVCGEIFSSLLDDRKTALGGSWFNVPNESTADAFLRRVKHDDPCLSVYEEYVAELKSRWDNAKEVSAADVAGKIAG